MALGPAPKVAALLGDEEEVTSEVWFRTALLTCALQSPGRVSPMFQSTEEAHSVRLFALDETSTFVEKWTQIPASQQALKAFSMDSEHFSAWMNLAEKAYTHARLAPQPVVSSDARKNTAAQAVALQSITGKMAAVLHDNDPDAQRAFFKAISRTNAPKSVPTLATTREATFSEDGLLPSHAYGVLGAYVRDDKWSVILCEDRGAQAEGEPFRIFAVPYHALRRNAASLVMMPR